MDAVIPKAASRPRNKRGERIVPPPAGTIKEAIMVMLPRDEVVRAWRDANMPDAEFKAAPGDMGVEIVVTIPDGAPASTIGSIVANLTGSNPAAELADRMRKFRSTCEAGEAPTTDGQTSGRAK